jgi:peptide/nickel transport system permease protein
MSGVLLEEFSRDYIRAARARGLTPAALVWGQALKNAAAPVITSLGMSLAMLLGGQAVVEKVFSWPGAGKYLIDAILRRDYNVVQCAVILFAVFFVTLNLIADMLCLLVNPQIRHSSADNVPYPAWARLKFAAIIRHLSRLFMRSKRERQQAAQSSPCSGPLQVFRHPLSKGAASEFPATSPSQKTRLFRLLHGFLRQIKPPHNQRTGICPEKPHSPLFLIGATLALYFLFIVLFGGLIAPHDPLKTDLARILLPPSPDYPLGTDNLGRCVFSRLIVGCRATLGTALLTEAAILGIGLCLGTAAGYFGGFFDGVMLVVIDILLAFPSLILALVIAGLLGQGLGNLTFTMIAVYWVEYARLARSMARSVRAKTFVMAAAASGSTSGGIIFRHILPHILPSMLVYATLGMSHIIIGISSLSFIGLGVQPPFPEWGAMITEAREYMGETPLPLAAVAFCIVCSVVCFQCLGEALRDHLDPRQSQLGLFPHRKRPMPEQGKSADGTASPKISREPLC